MERYAEEGVWEDGRGKRLSTQGGLVARARRKGELGPALATNLIARPGRMGRRRARLAVRAALVCARSTSRSDEYKQDEYDQEHHSPAGISTKCAHDSSLLFTLAS